MSGFIFIRQRLLTFVDSADLHGFEDVEVAAETHLSAKGASQSDEGESFSAIHDYLLKTRRKRTNIILS